MATAEEIIAALRAKRVRLWADGDQLRLSAPKDALTPLLREEITERKAELLAYLRGQAAEVGRPPILRHHRADAFPVSFGQERVWFLHQLDPEGSAHNIALALDIDGELNVGALEKSLTELLRRHEVLRTTFLARDGVPCCVISPLSEVSLEVIDLTALGTELAERERGVRTDAEARRPFDLEQGPLVRFSLMRLGEKRHRLMVTQHHIITDRWSLGVMSRDVAALYDAYSRGEESPLSDLPTQYVDFAAWQRNWLQGEALERQLGYWRDQLRDPLPTLALPTDRPRPALLTTAASTISLIMPPDLRDRLAKLGSGEGCSLFVVLLAAFQTLLFRLSGQEDLLVGTPVAGRITPELEDLMGYFINTLVLRTDLGGGPSFRDLLGRVRAVTLGALAHQDLPFEKLVAEIDPQRDPSRSPLVQVTFALQNLPAAVELPESVRMIEGGGSNFDLSLYVVEMTAGLHATLEYNESLFDEETARLLLQRYQTVLEGAATDPDRSIEDLPLLSKEEVQRISDWNSTTRPFPTNETVCDLIEGRVSLHPDRVALISQDRSLTYADLSHQSAALARRLRTLGCGPGSTVAVAVGRSVELVVSLLGVLKAGACYVPLDPAFPSPRLDFMLTDAGASVLVTEQRLVPDFSSSDVGVVTVDGAWMAEETEETSPLPSVGDADLAYVIYTSGSTGRPKGVEVPHVALANFLRSMAREPGMGEEDVLVSVTTPSFDIAGLELFLPLTVGARVVVATSEETADGTLLSDLLTHHCATVMQATPATWRLLLDAGWQGHERLKILCGGEALSRDLADHLLPRCGSLWNMYGPTETTIWSTIDRVPAGEEGISIGRPIDNTQIRLLDERGRPVSLGATGEICIGGTGLARGYRGRPELTAERFITDPEGGVAAGRLYRTGDLGRYRHDGRLECLGRLDHQVKVRGFRIEPGEVEALLRSHEAVRDAAVVARADRLVAFVVYEPGLDLTATEIRRFVGRELPEYMVPSMVTPIQALPLTLNGKIDRQALPNPFKRGHVQEEGHVPPATEKECLVADVWRSLIGVEQIGAHDNFYEVGGHSLLSVQAVHAIEERTGHRLNPRVMFFQSLRQIAATLPGAAEPAERT